MSIESEYLYDAVLALKTDLVTSLKNAGRSATGKTEQEILIEVISPTHIQLTAPAYFYALETGRKPTGQNATAGDPLMIDRIKEWVAAKGIPSAAAWAIKKSIDKNGYVGKPGVISEPLSDENVDRLINPALEGLAELYTNQILAELKPLEYAA